MASCESLRGFLERIDTIINTDGCLVRDFQSLKQQSQRYKLEKTFSTVEGEKPCNFKKNRFRDILAFDHTRIVLQEIDDVNGSDYINANYLTGSDGNPFYIAAQGPLSHTVVDFWRMIWEKEVKLVLMAGKEYEMGKHKCYRYWVNENEETKPFGDMEVSLISEKILTEEYLIRVMKMKKEEEERKVTQIHYHMWPDHGVPSSFTPLINILKIMRDLQPHNQIPIVIHCSAGCGRTGTICAVDYIWESLKKTDFSPDFSIFDLISNMRTERPAIVQTQEQYEIVHIAVREITSLVLKEMYNVYFDHTYENVEHEKPEHFYENVEAIKQTLEPDYVAVSELPADDRAGAGEEAPPPKPSRFRPQVPAKPQLDHDKPQVPAKPQLPVKAPLKKSRQLSSGEAATATHHQEVRSPPPGEIKALIAGLEASGSDALKMPPVRTKHLLKKNSEGHLPIHERPSEQATGSSNRPKMHSRQSSNDMKKLSEVISHGLPSPTSKPRPTSSNMKITGGDSASQPVPLPGHNKEELKAFKEELKLKVTSDDSKVTTRQPLVSPKLTKPPCQPPPPPSPKQNSHPLSPSGMTEGSKLLKEELELTFQGSDDSKTFIPPQTPKISKPFNQTPHSSRAKFSKSPSQQPPLSPSSIETSQQLSPIISRKISSEDNPYEYVAPDESEKPHVEERDSGSKGFVEARSRIEANFTLNTEKSEGTRKVLVGSQQERDSRFSVGSTSPEITKRHQQLVSGPSSSSSSSAGISPSDPKDGKGDFGGGVDAEYSYIPAALTRKSLVVATQREKNEEKNKEISKTGAETIQSQVHTYEVVNLGSQEEQDTSVGREESSTTSALYETVNSQQNSKSKSTKLSESNSPPPTLPERTKDSYTFIDIDVDSEEPQYQTVTPADFPQYPSEVSTPSSEPLQTPSKTSTLAEASGDTSRTKKMIANTKGFFTGFVKIHAAHKKEKYSLQTQQQEISNPTYGENDKPQAISFKASNNSDLSYPNKIGKPKGPRDTPKSWKKPSLSNI